MQADQMMRKLPQLANSDGELVRRGRFLEVTFLLEIGTDHYLVRIHRGRIEAIERGPHVQPRWTFALRAAPAAWHAFWVAAAATGFP